MARLTVGIVSFANVVGLRPPNSVGTAPSLNFNEQPAPSSLHLAEATKADCSELHVAGTSSLQREQG